MLTSPLTIFALAIAPIVTVIFAVLYVRRPDPVSQPSMLAAAALGLSSIAILLARSSQAILAAFQQIATSRTSGLKAVVAGLMQAQQPLAWGLIDFVGCFVALLLVAVFVRYQRDEETPLMHAYVALPALIVTAVFVVTLFLIVYFQYGTVDLVMMVCDKHRYQELASQFGTTSPADFAARISARLVSTFFLSILQFFALILAGVLDLVWRQKQEPRQKLATVLTLGAVVGCGAGILSELGFVDYLQHLQ